MNHAITYMYEFLYTSKAIYRDKHEKNIILYVYDIMKGIHNDVHGNYNTLPLASH